MAKMMKVDMQDLKSTEVQAMSDDDIKKVITDGKGKMKPVKTVSGASLDDVVAYVRSLKK
jgi:ribosomal protein L19E